MMVADHMIKRGLLIDNKGFAIGNLGPDCNVEDSRGKGLHPPREVTHYMSGVSKLTTDYERFYREEILNRGLTCPQEEGFLIGYYVHLLVDLAFQLFVRNPLRVDNIMSYVDQSDDLSPSFKHHQRDFTGLKKAFGRDRLFAELYQIEKGYLSTSSPSLLRYLFDPVDFPDYMKMFPSGAVGKKLKTIRSYFNQEIPSYDPLFMDPEEVTIFLEETTDFIMDKLANKSYL